MPSHLWLTIHESIGHSTELDRALGYEANYAGTSFLTPDKLGKQRIGSEHRQRLRRPHHAERASRPAATTTTASRPRSFPIIEKGIFKRLPDHPRPGAPDRREGVARLLLRRLAGRASRSSACPTFGSSPASRDVTLDDLIAGVDDGILIDGDGSCSIDQQRYNFQFGGDAFWEIKGGKKRGMLSRVAYQSRTPDFWQACDGIAGPSYWQQWRRCQRRQGRARADQLP